MLRYTGLRFGLFVVSFVVIWGLVRLRVLPAGLGDSNYLWVLLLALVVSGLLSFVLLRGAREKASVQISRRVDQAKQAWDTKAGDEDAADDAARSA
ncbi:MULTISPECIES: DUF4229 domain-containing protein [Streptomycetaceae]|uniref:DUF4229 domain-containing protein n=1 Tax=Streptantibioticus cattleyicolor (strain ATCC 35852 / DSM 46488 / JCM 4925 / NBRC 14057 / NRRL 8057) TaxID=1003195 RepID=F8JWM4_STREN|nr:MULTISPECIES: DUF4229 domain-containing protein [Streptomycetaceae]AEW95811.1 hypothetical protein SCATT_34400 [Streptantibioticus cattleyicolor NRRL 8057 = DSM 46488]MYS60354.1 DUF4229 domain-containing protein [Streptomyces sp. SID5468]CCB76150.1 conserved protein of unknown function [Streptantibioticus cattleyicolor NRRL 8057 = DSM 46488]